MVVLLAFAFAGGALTILSPCTLPVLPFVLGSVGAANPRRIVGVISGFAASFVLSAVLLTAVFAALGITTQPLRIGAALVLGLFGLTLVVPPLNRWFEGRSAGLAALGTRVGANLGGGFLGGFVLGAAIGLIWAPCVGPIMAAVMTTAVVAGPSGGALAVAVAYVAGAACSLVAVALLGRRTIAAIGGGRILAPAQRAFGLSMIAAAATVVTGLDLVVGQAFVPALPTNVVEAIAGVEERAEVQKELSAIQPGGVQLDDLGKAPEVSGITAWINTEPLSLASLRGKVVLVHFWTFGCINCIHVQPYVKAWYERYADAGFVVLGVHTPELSFERDIANVRKAVADAGVRFPVAFDPSYATWQAYGNHYWPAFYFVDRAGRIRHVHFGEGDYEGSEQVIRQLLAEEG